MPVPQMTLIATKLGDPSSSTQMVFVDSTGSIRFVFVMTSADTSSLNTNVFGGTQGATRSFTYGPDATASLMPYGTTIAR